MKPVLIFAASVLLLSGCASTANAEPLRDVTGMAGDTAQDRLVADGYKVKFLTDDGGAVWLPSNWTVNMQIPAAGAEVEPGGIVTLGVIKPESTAASAPPAAPAAPDPALATSTGLTATYAQAACTQYGDQQFPFGFKGHWIMGKLAEEIQNDQWFFKVEATVTNEFNAEREYNVECFVAGTNDAPTVATFNAY
jgi:hypothetical protein